MSIVINRQDLAVIHAASKDPTRYNLCGILIEADGTLVATDGHMMLIGSRDHDAPGLEADTIMARGDVEALKKMIPAHGEASLSKGDRDLMAEAGSMSARYEPVDGEFPNWRQVIPDGVPEVKVRVDARLLERLAKAAIEYAGSRKDPVFLDLEITDELTPVKAKYEREDGATLDAIVMPARKS